MYWDDELELVNSTVRCPKCDESYGFFLRHGEVKCLHNELEKEGLNV